MPIKSCLLHWYDSLVVYSSFFPGTERETLLEMEISFIYKCEFYFQTDNFYFVCRASSVSQNSSHVKEA